MTTFDKMTAFEKGIAAQILVSSLIRQGQFGNDDRTNKETEIIILVKKWQLDLMACFSRSDSQNMKMTIVGTSHPPEKRSISKTADVPLLWRPWGSTVAD